MTEEARDVGLGVVVDNLLTQQLKLSLRDHHIPRKRPLLGGQASSSRTRVTRKASKERGTGTLAATKAEQLTQDAISKLVELDEVEEINTSIVMINDAEAEVTIGVPGRQSVNRRLKPAGKVLRRGSRHRAPDMRRVIPDFTLDRRGRSTQPRRRNSKRAVTGSPNRRGCRSPGHSRQGTRIRPRGRLGRQSSTGFAARY